MNDCDGSNAATDLNCSERSHMQTAHIAISQEWFRFAWCNWGPLGGPGAAYAAWCCSPGLSRLWSRVLSRVHYCSPQQ